MLSRQTIIILALLISVSSFSQNIQKSDCENRIEELYHKQHIHLIFCSYYFEKVNNFSGADSILNTLTFYRDTANFSGIEKKDRAIIGNLEKEICNKDTSLITDMEKWCEASRKIAWIRSEVNFTLEGYMELLYECKYTTAAISPYLKNNRTVYSLSTDEMEWIYFSSISVIKGLKIDEQNIFFNKMRGWDFK